MNTGLIVETTLAAWGFKQTAFLVPPTTLFFSLHSADPQKNGQHEITGAGYARAELDPDPDQSTFINYAVFSFGPMGEVIITNAAPIVFPTSAGSWNSGNPIGFWGLHDSASTGLFILGGTITGTPLVVATTGVIVTAAPGGMQVTIS